MPQPRYDNPSHYSERQVIIINIFLPPDVHNMHPNRSRLVFLAFRHVKMWSPWPGIKTPPSSFRNATPYVL